MIVRYKKKKKKLAGYTSTFWIKLTEKQIQELEKQKLGQEEKLKPIEETITIYTTELSEAQASIIEIDNGIQELDKTFNDIQTKKGQIQNDIPNLETELQQLKDNYEKNKIDSTEVKRQNKLIAKKYEEAFNIANLNRINIQQEPYESEDNFIKRLQALESEKFDVNIYNDRAEGEQKKWLSEKLKNVIRNDNIIWEVIKGLTTKQIFETNEYFNIISTRLLTLFG